MNRRNAFILGGGALVIADAATVGLSKFQMGSMGDYDASVAKSRAALAKNPALKDLVRFATLAASGHNTQPWRFRIGEGQVEILPDFSRRTAIVDPDDHHLFVSLGCAAENLAVAAGAHGRPGTLRFNPANDGSVVFEFTTGPSTPSALSDAIPRRQSTRTEYDGRPIPVADLKSLAEASAVSGIDLILLTEPRQIEPVRDLVIAGNTAQMADAAFLRELKTWLRFNPRRALASGDGLFSAASGSPNLPTWLGPFVFDRVFRVGAENDKYARQLRSSSGVAVFVSEKDDRDHWFRAGRACQRFALKAAALGLKVAYVNQPVEVARLRPELASLVGLPGRRPDLVIRFGCGPRLPFSPRRPVETVLV